MTLRLKEKFDSTVAPKLDEQFGIQNKLARPKLEKIVINVGMGKELDGTKVKAHVRDQVPLRHHRDRRPEADHDQGAQERLEL